MRFTLGYSCTYRVTIETDENPIIYIIYLLIDLISNQFYTLLSIFFPFLRLFTSEENPSSPGNETTMGKCEKSELDNVCDHGDRGNCETTGSDRGSSSVTMDVGSDDRGGENSSSVTMGTSTSMGSSSAIMVREESSKNSEGEDGQYFIII